MTKLDDVICLSISISVRSKQQITTFICKMTTVVHINNNSHCYAILSDYTMIYHFDRVFVVDSESVEYARSQIYC